MHAANIAYWFFRAVLLADALIQYFLNHPVNYTFLLRCPTFPPDLFSVSLGFASFRQDLVRREATGKAAALPGRTDNIELCIVA